MPQPFLLLIAANLALAGFLGWKWSLWPVLTWLEVQRTKAVFFLTLYDSINYTKYFQNYLHHTSAVPQPFLLLIAAILAVAGFLGCKWSLWHVPTWLAIQRSKYVFLLTSHVRINDMKNSRTVCITPHPCHSHLLLIAANLALAIFLGWKWSLWPVLTWLSVQRSKYVFLLTLHVSINDMKIFRTVFITPQPCHSHFCCWLLPIWP